MRVAISSADQYPGRNHRVNGACGVAPRSAAPPIDPAPAPQEFGAYRGDGRGLGPGWGGTGGISRLGVRSTCDRPWCAAVINGHTRRQCKGWKAAFTLLKAMMR